MGDAGEGLIDAEARIQERMEELERERAARTAARSCAIRRRCRRSNRCGSRARSSTGSWSRRRTSAGAAQIAQAIAEIDRRMTEIERDAVTGARRDLRPVHRYHDGTKHHFHRFARSLGYLDWASQPNPFRSFAGRARDAAGAVRSPAGPLRPAFHARRSASAIAATRRRRAPPRARPVGVEAVRRIALGAARQPVQRQSPPDGSLRHRRSGDGSAGRAAACTTTRPTGTRSSGGAPSTPTRGGRAAADRRLLAHRADVDPLARGVEVRRARVPLLPARPGPRDRGRVGSRRRSPAGARRCCRTGRTATSPRSPASIATRTTSTPSAKSPGCLIGSGRRPRASSRRPQASAVRPVARRRRARRAVDRPREPVERGPRRVDVHRRQSPRATRGSRATSAARQSARNAACRESGRSLRSRSRCAAAAAAAPQRRRVRRTLDDRSRARFFAMLSRVMPARGAPWDALWWTPRIHLALFVHRVDGRRRRGSTCCRAIAAAVERLRAALRARVPVGARRRRAAAARVWRAATAARSPARLSCDQDIAADGFFSLGMLAEFDASLRSSGRRSTGTCSGNRAWSGRCCISKRKPPARARTGIGCFYDDPVHDVLGLTDHAFQSLYHFTVGMPVEDTRLTTEPGYSKAASAVGSRRPHFTRGTAAGICAASRRRFSSATRSPASSFMRAVAGFRSASAAASCSRCPPARARRRSGDVAAERAELAADVAQPRLGSRVSFGVSGYFFRLSGAPFTAASAGTIAGTARGGRARGRHPESTCSVRRTSS